MCIRDRSVTLRTFALLFTREPLGEQYCQIVLQQVGELLGGCLLYTSDAADERSSVDLGGRRIIKKKKIEGRGGTQCE